MAVQGSFHVSSDVNRLYERRKEGGTGLTSTEEVYIRRTTGMADHLEMAQHTNSSLRLVKDHEQNHVITISWRVKYAAESDSSYNKLNDAIKKQQQNTWKNKVTKPRKK